MKLAFLSIGLSIALAPLSLADGHAASETAGTARTPLAIPTFHCLGLYWSPPAVETGIPCGSSAWPPVVTLDA